MQAKGKTFVVKTVVRLLQKRSILRQDKKNATNAFLIDFCLRKNKAQSGNPICSLLSST